MPVPAANVISSSKKQDFFLRGPRMNLLDKRKWSIYIIHNLQAKILYITLWKWYIVNIFSKFEPNEDKGKLSEYNSRQFSQKNQGQTTKTLLLRNLYICVLIELWLILFDSFQIHLNSWTSLYCRDLVLEYFGMAVVRQSKLHQQSHRSGLSDRSQSWEPKDQS